MNKKIVYGMLALCMVGCVVTKGTTTSYAGYKTEVIKNNVLKEYSGNAEAYKVPDNVKVIKTNAFAKAKKLKKLIISKNVRNIERDSISCAHNLKQIKVVKANKSYSSMDGVLYNKKGTKLYLCPAKKKTLTISDRCKVVNNLENLELEQLVIGKNVKKIEDYSMQNVKKLKSIRVKSGNKKYCASDGVLFELNKYTGKKLVKYPAAKSCKEYNIPEDVAVIGDYAFSYADIESIVVPENVKLLCENVFYYTNAKNITFEGKCIDNRYEGNSNSILADQDFSLCKNLQTMTFNDKDAVLPPVQNSFNWFPETIKIIYK